MNITNSTNATENIILPSQSSSKSPKYYELSPEQAEKAAEDYKRFSAFFVELRNINLEEYKELKAKGERGETLSSNEFQEMVMFMSTPEYNDQMKLEKLEYGNKQDIAKIVTIGNDEFTISYKGWVTGPHKYGSHSSGSGNIQEIMNNLYAAFGKENVHEETFEKGEGPTNAEYWEKNNGKSFYRYVMSEGRFG